MVVAAVERKSYSGPIPPAIEVQKYEKILTGAADRILSLAETEQQIRKSSIKYNFRTNNFVILASIMVSFGLIGAAFWYVYLGEPWFGVALGISIPVASIMRKAFEKRK